MSVLNDILDWSAERPLWQRDALRRSITSGNLGKVDILVLTRMCLAEHGVNDVDSRAATSVPLSEEHLRETRCAADQVRLVRLSDVRGVNTLATGQQMIVDLMG